MISSLANIGILYGLKMSLVERLNNEANHFHGKCYF